MVATAAKHHRGPVAAHQVDINHMKEKKGGGLDGGAGGSPAALGVDGPLGGFIFVCNNDTMSEDLERHLFGLPQRYQDSVRAIQPGLPLFLYNYSTRCLHGVFEASSDGGLNIEPEAWENKETRKNGRPVSRFPAQVRVRWREERPPLEEEKFRPLLYHYDGPKFRLELTISEAEDLLKLFGTSSTQKPEKTQDDLGGEWERVKSKSKLTRVHRPIATKRSSSPNPSSGRRRPGPPVNGLSTNISTSQSTAHYSANGDFGRGREARADTAQRWRSDSDSWSGSSSAGISTSSWASHDEDKPKKGIKENGVAYVETNGVVRAGEYLDQHNAATLKAYEQIHGLCENGSERDSRADSDELNTEINGTRSSLGGDSQLGSQSPNRPGFASYSAALKAGMTGALTDASSCDCVEAIGVAEIGQTSAIRVASNVNVAVPSSANADLAGDGTKVGSGKHIEAAGSRRVSAHSESGTHPVLGSCNVELVWQERKDGKQTCWDAEGRKVENRQVYRENKSVLAATPAVSEDANRASFTEGESVGGRMNEGSHPLGRASPGDVISSGKKSLLEGSLATEGERASKQSPSSQGRPALKGSADSTSVVSESTGKKISWQGNDAVVLCRLLEPGLGSNSGTPLSVTTSGQHTQTYPDGSSCLAETGVKLSPQLQEIPGGRHNAGHVNSPGDVQPSPWQTEQTSGMPLSATSYPASQGLQTKAQVQGSLSLPTRSVHDPRRSQQYNVPKERDEKVQFRRAQSPSPEQAPPMIQQRQAGQSLMPVRISTPPLQQHFQHPALSPELLNANYIERRTGPDVGLHGMAYRPIARSVRDGEFGLQNGVVPGGWGPPPVPVMQQCYPLTANGMFPLPPPHLLANAEELHLEILEFAHSASPSAEARIGAEAAIDCVRDAVRRLWPSADVEVFGSYATGLCLSHSDVDVVVVDAPPPPETPETAGLYGARVLAPSIRLLGTSLRAYDWCENITTIESATMPVIKLHCKPPVISADSLGTPAPVVKIDITIGGKKTRSVETAPTAAPSEGLESSRPVSKFEAASKIHNGAAAREYVIKRLHQQPALAPLVLLLKSYLQSKGLKDVYTGGLGSFSLTIMLVFYLERVSVACGTPQEVKPQVLASVNAPGTPASPSADTTKLASIPSGTDSLDSYEEELACSTASTDTVSVPNRTSASSSSSEGSLVNGAAAASHIALPVDPLDGGPCNRWTGGIVEQLLGSMHTVSSPNLGILLVGFLHIFGGDIDFTQVRLVTKGNGGSGGLFYHDKSSRPVALTIDDPLRPGSNIGAGSFNMHRVQVAMKEMLQILTRSPPMATSERVGKGPGRRRPLPLLDQLFMSGNACFAPQ